MFKVTINLDPLVFNVIEIFIEIGKIIPSYNIIDAEKNATITSILGDKNEMINTIMIGSIEYTL